jgi:hypothetical protein
LGIPVSGGTLLRSATFSPIAGTYTGPTTPFNDLTFQAGTQYFIGFFNVQGLGSNEATGSGLTQLPTYFQGSPDAFHLYNQTYSSDAPALRFTDSVPAPEPRPIFLAAAFIAAMVLRSCLRSKAA